MKVARRIAILAFVAALAVGFYHFGAVYLWPPPNTSTIKVVGMIEAPEVNLTSRIAGRIMWLDLLEGDHVKRGQVVCRIEDVDLRNQLRRARADLAQALANFSDARLNLHRMIRLYASHVVSTKDRDDARTQYDQTAAAVASARANVDYYRDQLRDTVIRSPINGVIVNKALEVGEWVTPGTPVLTVDDLSTIWARVDVQETDLPSIYVGKPAEVTLPTHPPVTFTGRVMAIGQEAQFATERDVRRGRQDIRTFYVKVQLLQNEHRAKPGMTAEVSFAREDGTSRFARDSYQRAY
jgi:RND family efflux transporter MFP subunit